VKTEWVPAAFDAIILGVQSGKYDVGVSSFTINAERMQQATMVSATSTPAPSGCPEGQPEGR
jgi:polar amino acid transport system substrate-binding protein